MQPSGNDNHYGCQKEQHSQQRKHCQNQTENIHPCFHALIQLFCHDYSPFNSRSSHCSASAMRSINSSGQGLIPRSISSMVPGVVPTSCDSCHCVNPRFILRLRIFLPSHIIRDAHLLRTDLAIFYTLLSYLSTVYVLQFSCFFVIADFIDL